MSYDAEANDATMADVKRSSSPELLDTPYVTKQFKEEGYNEKTTAMDRITARMRSTCLRGQRTARRPSCAPICSSAVWRRKKLVEPPPPTWQR